MTVAYGGATAAGTQGTTSCPADYPGSVQAGWLLLLHVSSKYPPNSPSTPAGWTLLAQATGGSGASGVDSGQVYSTVYYRIADGTETGTVTVTVTSGNSCRCRMIWLTKDSAKTWSIAAAIGSDSSADGSWSVTGDANPGITAGDFLLALSTANMDTATFDTHAMSATGATIGSATERYDLAATTGDDLRIFAATADVTAGPASAAPVYTATPTGGSPAGAAVIVRAREYFNEALSAETITVSDAAAEGIQYSESPSESVSVSDAAAALAQWQEPLSESATVSDAAATSVTLYEVPSDAVSVADTAAGAVTFLEVPADAATLSDAADEDMVLVELVIEDVEVVVSDAVDTQTGFSESLDADVVTVADYAKAGPWRVGHRGRVRILAEDGNAV